MRITADLNAHATSAGITTAIFYLVGTLPLILAVSDRLDLSAELTSSWICISYLSIGIAGWVLSLAYRQPLPIGWTIPGLIYLGTLAGEFSFAQMVGANLLVGLATILIGALRLGNLLLRWLPLPIVLGMFAGSILGYLTRMVAATTTDLAIGGATVAGFLLGRALGSPRLPPLLLALATGAVASLAWGEGAAVSVQWAAPVLVLAPMQWSWSSLVAIALPMLILSVGLGTVQGLGYLKAQDYDVPVAPVTVIVGICSTLNALFGGLPAIAARSAVAILANPQAGPKHARYTGNLIASSGLIVIGLFATPLASLVHVLPTPYVTVLAGLAILAPFQDAVQKAFTGKLQFGAVVAFAVAATPFAVFGMTSAVWALIAGTLASWCAEHDALRTHQQG